ncbi:hypothetical protein [Mycolicibacterium stellerae]|uniref:hypothetical protein n=1 Tax=Mycolicibacterium stellerae TaxID=2358193 RepID=UPI00389906C2
MKAKAGAVAAVALAVVASAPATSSAEPPVPNVKYILTSETGATLEVSYLAVQPPSMEAYNADAYAFLKREEVSTPWEFTTTLEDPQWAFLQTGRAGHGGQGNPRPHCEIVVDGQIAVSDTQDSAAFCKLSRW